MNTINKTCGKSEPRLADVNGTAELAQVLLDSQWNEAPIGSPRPLIRNKSGDATAFRAVQFMQAVLQNFQCEVFDFHRNRKKNIEGANLKISEHLSSLSVSNSSLLVSNRSLSVSNRSLQNCKI